MGNPGLQYKNNRHNIGYMVIEELGRQLKVILRKNTKLKALMGKINVGGQDIILVKPSTFMNNSGLCVRRVLDNYQISCDE